MSEPTDPGTERPQPPHGTPPPQGHQPAYGQPSFGQPPHSQPSYGPAPYGQPSYPPRPPLSPSDEQTWAVLSHIGALVLTLLSAGTLGWLPPLVIWLVFRGRSPYLDDHAKESLNFQVTLLIAYVVGLITLFAVIGILILVAAFVLALVCGIMASVAASRHEPYRYPVSIRFVS